MTRTAAYISTLFFALSCGRPVGAQSVDPAEQLKLGRAAMDAHDPAKAIRHFEQADTREGREWLAVALMMESRSASDRYVERAFDAAMRARAAQPSRPPSRAELAAALRPGEMVIAVLTGETSAWAWAFDHDAFVGYPLPSPAEIATDATRIEAYLASGDREGVARIADDLMPALLGPALGRLPQLKRLIFEVDGPLRGIPLGALPAAGDAPLEQQLAVAMAADGALLDAINAESHAEAASFRQPRPAVMVAIAITIGLIAVAVFVRRLIA